MVASTYLADKGPKVLSLALETNLFLEYTKEYSSGRSSRDVCPDCWVARRAKKKSLWWSMLFGMSIVAREVSLPDLRIKISLSTSLVGVAE